MEARAGSPSPSIVPFPGAAGPPVCHPTSLSFLPWMRAAAPPPPPTVASAPSAPQSASTHRPGVGLSLLALSTCVALVALSSMESRPPEQGARLLLQPRDIDIHLVNGSSCALTGRRSTLLRRWTGQPDHHLAEHLLDLYGA